MNNKTEIKNKLERMFSGNKLNTISEKPLPPPPEVLNSKFSSLPEGNTPPIVNYKMDRRISIDTDEVPTKNNPLSNNKVKANADDNIESNGNSTIIYVLSCFNNCCNSLKSK
jgi:hypothetical protein